MHTAGKGDEDANIQIHKEVGLANLCRSSVSRGAVFRL